MYETLFLGVELIELVEVNSTNLYLKYLLENSKQKPEGVTVVAKQQKLGRGQMGTVWESEKGKNLTFSFLLRPKLAIRDQFLLSKIVSLGIVSFLRNLGIKDVKIKWPNDIYVKDNKIAGILIENTLKSNQLETSVVGIGLNVNQIHFSEEIEHVTSLKKLLNKELDVKEMLHQLLFFIEKEYLQKLKVNQIDEAYFLHLYRLNEQKNYLINGGKCTAKIVGVAASGKLQLLLNETVQEVDLKEVKFC